MTKNWVEINDECTTLVVKLNSKLQCQGQVYVTIVIHKYLLKELQ